MSPRLAGWTLVAASAGFTVAGFLIGRDPIDLLFAPTLLIIGGWKPVVLALALSWAVAAASRALAPGPMAESGLPNPAGVASFPALGDLADISLTFMVVVFLLLGAGSVFLRFRSARGQERAQLKWFALAATLLAAEVLLANLLDAFLPQDSNLALWVSALAFNMVLLFVPAAMAVAILRYRLYDIDLVINRTLVYGALTATLAGVYVAGVVGLPLLLPLQGDSDLFVAGSTLAVAALFSPARRRIQGFVDRRFYRRRYDAARTVEAFRSRLRNEVDLDTLSSDLQAVVRDTLQPASVSVWFRREGRAP